MGKCLANFGVTDVSQDETWVTVAEWMQKPGPNHILPVDNEYGSDGSVWVAKIHWNKPNRIEGEPSFGEAPRCSGSHRRRKVTAHGPSTFRTKSHTTEMNP